MNLIKSLAASVLALALITPVAAAAADVTLINVFEVPQGREKEAIQAWEKARDFLAAEPGYGSTSLHMALNDKARFQLINIAKWQSPAQFAQAIKRLRASASFPKVNGLKGNAALYRVIR